ncbi:LysR substrate-binding domain-containing protein [Vibrio paucivorans]
MDNRLRHLSGLRYFEAAARMNSYSKAAQELFISQAAVSQKIRQLEEALGCKLFVRQGREMALTDKGQSLYQQVCTGFEHIITGLNQIQCEPINGLLNVSSPPSFASRWLLPRLWKFSMHHPEIPIKVHTTCDKPDLKYSEVDIAIVQGNEFDLGSDIETRILIDEEIYAYCSPQLAKSMKFTSPQQLQKCWLVHFGSESFTWDDWFARAGVSVNKGAIQWMEVSTFEMGLSAVIAGHGVCLASESLASDFIEKGLLVRPFDIGLSPGLSFTLCSDPSSSRLARCQVFSDWLFEEIGLMPTNKQIS